MKQIIVLCSVMALCASIASAALPFSLGVKGGLNLSSASYDPDVPAPLTTSNRTAFAIGAVAEVGLGGAIFIAVEPMYIQKGNVINGTIQGVPATETNKEGFLEIPILFKAKLMKSSVRPYAVLGPAIGILLSSTATVEATGFQTQDIDTKDNVASTDFSIIVGAGAEFALNKAVSVTVDARYSLGLADLAKDPAGAPDQKAKSRGIQFLVGALFAI